MTIDNRTGSEHNENNTAGKLAGTGAGVLAGAQIGTVLLPIPVVGTFTGALVGGLLGNKIGKRFGAALLDKMDITSEAPSASKANLSKELERLIELHESGILSNEEFKAAKARLLGL